LFVPSCRFYAFAGASLGSRKHFHFVNAPRFQQKSNKENINFLFSYSWQAVNYWLHFTKEFTGVNGEKPGIKENSMGKDILNDLSANYAKVNELFEKFIETCPEDIWAGKIGKFPVWQQIYHTYACFDFFLAEKGQTSVLKPLYPQEVRMFSHIPDTPATKEAITNLVKEANLYMEKFFAGLDDQALSNPHEGFSARRQSPCTNAGTINIVIGHMFYHFGQCDAALRDHGLKGLF
jgi:uncharacterized damage-inducible protein DinB